MEKTTLKELEEEELFSNIIPDQIKLIKNSRGYNWEIKLNCTDIDKLKKLDNRMKEEFENDILP
jgi:hypothetical protein